jgi:hypothetical protein
MLNKRKRITEAVSSHTLEKKPRGGLRRILSGRWFTLTRKNTSKGKTQSKRLSNRSTKPTKTEAVLSWRVFASALLGVIIPIVVGSANGYTIGVIALISTTAFLTVLAIVLYGTAASFRHERNISRAIASSAQSHRDALHIKYKAVKGLRECDAGRHRQELQTRQEEIDDLRDQISDLQTTASKVGTQQAVIDSLHKRIANLNHLVQHGTEKHSGTTLADVRRLTGEIKSDKPDPTFQELEDQLESDNNDD